MLKVSLSICRFKPIRNELFYLSFFQSSDNSSSEASISRNSNPMLDFPSSMKRLAMSGANVRLDVLQECITESCVSSRSKEYVEKGASQEWH